MSLRKRFPGFETDAIEQAFGLKRVAEHPALQKWLTTALPLAENEREFLNSLKAALWENVSYWNEEELKVRFIAPLVKAAEYDTEHYRYFLERALHATVDNIEISCVVDFIIAEGRGSPQKPYFCIHEYKKERSDPDPLGQLLLQMLAAQTLNGNPHEPLYGAYILGRMWVFVVLVQREYGISLAYDATKDDLYSIFAILKALKPRIEAILQNS